MCTFLGKKVPQCCFSGDARIWSVVSSFISDKEDHRSMALVNRTARSSIRPGVISRNNNTGLFGYNRDVTSLILSYVPNVRDMYNLSMVNKLIREIISLDIDLVIGCALRHGGRPFQTVANIAHLVEKHAIYVPSPLRLLRQVNGRLCEFCLNDPKYYTDDWYGENFRTFLDYTAREKRYPNSRPAAARPNFGVNACINCLTKERPEGVSGNWRYRCLTKRWYRCFRDRESGQQHYKQIYLAHRHMFYTLFSRDDIASYPYGQRRNKYVFDHPIWDSDGDIVRLSLDAWEVLWAGPVRDTAGELVGSLINYNLLKPLVDDILSPKNTKSIEDTITSFIYNKVPERQPNAVYFAFSRSFKKRSQEAYKQRDKVRLERKNSLVRARFNKVDKTVEAISVLINAVRPSLLKRACLGIEYNPGKKDVDMLIRFLLCYREEANNYRLKRAVTYDTGSMKYDNMITKCIKDILLYPSAFLEHVERADDYVMFIYRTFLVTRGVFWKRHKYKSNQQYFSKNVVLTGFEDIPAVSTISGEVKQGFANHRYRRSFDDGPMLPRIPQWTDTNSERNI